MQPKLPGNLSNQELLDLLNKEGVQETTGKYKNDVVNFITHYKITTGNTVVQANVLYRLYKLWSETPCTNRVFYRLLGIYIPITKKKYQSLIKINIKPLDIIELLEVSKKQPRDPIKSFTRKKILDKFFATYNIKPGNFFVESFVLYHLYDTFYYDNNYKHQLNEKNFLRVLKLYFEVKGNKAGVHEEILKALPKEVIDVLRNTRKTGRIFSDKKEKK